MVSGTRKVAPQKIRRGHGARGVSSGQGALRPPRVENPLTLFPPYPPLLTTRLRKWRATTEDTISDTAVAATAAAAVVPSALDHRRGVSRPEAMSTARKEVVVRRSEAASRAQCTAILPTTPPTALRGCDALATPVESRSTACNAIASWRSVQAVAMAAALEARKKKKKRRRRRARCLSEPLLPVLLPVLVLAVLAKRGAVGMHTLVALGPSYLVEAAAMRATTRKI